VNEYCCRCRGTVQCGGIREALSGCVWEVNSRSETVNASQAIAGFTLAVVASVLYSKPCSYAGSMDAGAKIAGVKRLIDNKFRGFRSFRLDSGASGSIPEIPDRFSKTY
jgi:hypothetical protein